MNPAAEYAARLEQRRLVCNRYERLHRTIGNLRLLVGIAAVVIAFFVFGQVWISPYWLIPPFLMFIALMAWHSRVLDTLERARRAVRFYEDGIARIESRWTGRGETGDKYRDLSHGYAEDLDIFGRGSLFELLCTARTQPGEDRLAQWLLQPAAVDELARRQDAVRELSSRLDLRETLAILGDTLRSRVHPEHLSRWGEQPPVLFPHGSQAIAATIVAAVLVTFSLYMAGVASRTPFLSMIFVELIFSFTLRAKVHAVNEAVEEPARDLALVADVLRCIEGERFGSQLLRELKQKLEVNGQIASERIRHLHRLVTRIENEHNQFLAPILAALLWGTQMAMAVERWRADSGPAIRRWLNAVGEFEALCSLAGYAYEHPADPFPAISAKPRQFDAEGIGHPLMPESGCVRNDVVLGDDVRLLIVSGSNMSGKSTLLRSVGLNVVLAWAGAPVRARRLETSPLVAGASIRVVDSLQDGRSRFYSEITRLRKVMDLATGERTLLFLIDEMLSGTNSHDRRIGAEAIVRSLVDRGAIGIITTHDLALADIAAALPMNAANVHFTDTIVDGRLNFDYRLHPGVVERSNALELMRSVGLEV